MHQYLETTGLLEHGTAEEVAAAKKIYWASVRKAWKQEHRNEYKSYTIFFTDKEQHLLESASIKSKCSNNSFIKNACMNLLTGRPNINKKAIGKVRESLAVFYNELKCLDENSNQSNSQIKLIIEKFIMLEKSILSFLNHT